MNKITRNLAIILAGAYLGTATLHVVLTDIKLAKENKISLENSIKNAHNAMINVPYTTARGIVGMMGKDILTGEELFPIMGAIPCIAEGMVDQMIYTLGIVIPYKTKNVGEKSIPYENLIETDL